jgi:deoxyribonuclease IV
MTKIGLKTLILHPGSALQSESTIALSQLVKGLNMILEEAAGVRIALETMCKRGGELGSEFEQLKYVIEQVNQQEKIGICWDTCHLYASGYDIKNNLERVIEEFDQKIGLDKL